MLSLRVIFRLMLLSWFAAAGLLLIFLNDRMENHWAGNLVARIFFAPSTPPATPVLRTEAPRKPVEPAKAPPEPVEAPPEPMETETGWTPMQNTRLSGEGRIGAPRFTVLPDKSLEVLLPYQGTLGGETHFAPRDVGIDTRLDAISVDLHGAWKFSRQTDAHIEKSVICRAQVYPHLGYVRVSVIACEQESGAPPLAARAFFSAGYIRLLFSPKG
ncbi:MAG: hypothetical protein LBD06_05595 [Candidatus Accumulibacter sp.]|jgi:hypothetical protein|nr:hypothetical protein [Accumulibacter sp.]